MLIGGRVAGLRMTDCAFSRSLQRQSEAQPSTSGPDCFALAARSGKKHRATNQSTQAVYFGPQPPLLAYH